MGPFGALKWAGFSLKISACKFCFWSLSLSTDNSSFQRPSRLVFSHLNKEQPACERHLSSSSFIYIPTTLIVFEQALQGIWTSMNSLRMLPDLRLGFLLHAFLYLEENYLRHCCNFDIYEHLLKTNHTLNLINDWTNKCPWRGILTCPSLENHHEFKPLGKVTLYK